MTSPIHDKPRFAAALSKSPNTRDAAREVCLQVRESLGAEPGLALVFASFHHQSEFQALAELLHDQLGGACLLGCTGESIVCNDQEIEGQPALALWVARVPGMSMLPMHLDFQVTPDGGTFVGWHDDLGEQWPAGSTLIVLGEPFSFPADLLLKRLNHQQPGVPVVGGMASGGWNPDQNRLLLGPRELRRGAAAVLLHGPLEVRTLVSQGCRPIGRPFVVTKAQANSILELGGQTALAQLQQMYEQLTPEEQEMARQGLHVGQVINEYQENFGRGDFLVRNVQGVDPQVGAIAIGDTVRVGQTVQFHVRDAATADEDLHALLAEEQKRSAGDCLAGLLFTCNGRGTRLFEGPHHDARAVSQHWKELPLAGFFAQGEIGPIGGQGFLHGFTASLALFRTRT